MKSFWFWLRQLRGCESNPKYHLSRCRALKYPSGMPTASRSPDENRLWKKPVFSCRAFSTPGSCRIRDYFHNSFNASRKPHCVPVLRNSTSNVLMGGGKREPVKNCSIQPCRSNLYIMRYWHSDSVVKSVPHPFKFDIQSRPKSYLQPSKQTI